MRSIVLILLVCAFAPAHAGSFTLHAATHHTGDGDFEETNPGVGYTFDGDIAPTVGVFRNSYGETSVYGGAQWRFSRHFSASLVAATGYEEETGSGVMPIALLSWRVTDHRVSPVVSVGPMVDGVVLLFSVNIR